MKGIHKNIRLKLLILLVFSSSSGLLLSCKKSGNGEFSNLPVVEAYLSPGTKIKVIITQKSPYDLNAEIRTTDINKLDIKVEYSDISYTLVSLGNGVYSDTAGIIPVIADSTYVLDFVYGDKTITSSTIIPRKPTSVTQSATSIKMSQIDIDNPFGGTMPDPVKITFQNSDDSYYMATVECIDNNAVSVFKDSVPSNDMFSSIPVTGTEISIQPMRIRYFGINRIILYHINPEYSTFFSQQASTSQSYQEPPSNIQNGFGIFTGINADTLYLDVIQAK
jgi:hypothetical protein